MPALQEAVGSASANTLFILTGVALVERTAVCGNQVGICGMARLIESTGMECNALTGNAWHFCSASQ